MPLLVLMGQVLMRMQLTWLGEPGPLVRTKNAFKVVLVIVISYFVYTLALEFASAPYTIDTVPGYIPALKLAGSILFSVWAVFSLCRTRESIRARYSIEETTCAGCEDLCCAFWCSCCTVAQVARHTGEYETYPATCCTQTGHPAGTPIGV
jgi:Cys-rich protein (TIGR01571 family)